MLDLTLAIAHHLLIFGIFGILFTEFWALRNALSGASVARIGSIDLWYGILAAAVIVIGFCRAIFAAKGWGYYSHNAFFWAKIAAFAAIGILSLPPTLTLYLIREWLPLQPFYEIRICQFIWKAQCREKHPLEHIDGGEACDRIP